ncbi:MAG: hypothetical protein RBS05_03340 [Zoogloea oleivorans]|jgi:hypothetical protein|uniref:hypothetical protein n=1 Tax=Zoogloea oleivorans TaxID=1552750 RepID=UPI002A367D32|nr:hypothetical protein [Zoogloea oleivorans]MDY0034923.1 hypothetical protein [Zoogloea oleivorans]
MHYPDFFDTIPRLQMHDPLADFLGAAEGGCIEYAYLDAVKLAGHSCPTVASAYWLTCLALRALYGATLPERGGVQVTFRDSRVSGVTGVIANVVSLLTGATTDTGFKGLAGRFDRRDLLAFDAEQPLDIRFTRKDSGAAVDAMARLRDVPADPQMAPLMQRCLAGDASADEAQRFRVLWQDRVRRVLLEHATDPDIFVIRHVD